VAWLKKGNLSGSVSRIDRHRKGFKQVSVMQFLLAQQFSVHAHITIVLLTTHHASHGDDVWGTLCVALKKL
jgi:hypothetical protein